MTPFVELIDGLAAALIFMAHRRHGFAVCYGEPEPGTPVLKLWRGFFAETPITKAARLA